MSSTDISEQSIKNELQKTFEETMQEYSSSEKSNGKLTVSIENIKNPYDSAGLNHNAVLDFIHSQSTTSLDSLTLLVKNEFPECKKFDFTANDVQSSVDSGLPLTIENGTNISDIYDTLVADRKISSEERTILFTTATAFFDADNINQKIEIVKDAENYILDKSGVSNNAKERMLVSYSILRYSTHYWEIVTDDEIDLACPACVQFADNSAAIWALNNVYTDGSSEDNWDNSWGFAGLVSSIVSVMIGW